MDLNISNETSSLLMNVLGELAYSLADDLIDYYEMPLEDLTNKLKRCPPLATSNNDGRNLICQAAMNWDHDRLALLIEFGADVETMDSGGHTPLYRVANGSGDEANGVACLILLISHGADVNRATGVEQTTALHNAARRGNLEIARSLVNAGANVLARDKKGDTPIQRAINCKKNEVAQFLKEQLG